MHGYFGLAFLAALLTVGAIPASAMETERHAAADVNHFAFALQQELLREHPGKNVFFSPYSLFSALTMTWTGAKGESAAQMAQVLHLSPSPTEAESGFAALNRALGKTPGVTLDMANALWGQRGYSFLPSFLNGVERDFGGTFTPLDFAGNVEQSRLIINDWVELKTAQKIRNLLPAGLLSPLTRLVLTNAVYFKGNWASPFPVERTAEGVFTRADGVTVTVPMMRQSGVECSYAELPGEAGETQLVLLPYEGGEMAMCLLLPARPLQAAHPEAFVPPLPAGQAAPLRPTPLLQGGAPDFALLNADLLQELLDRAESARVSLLLPRFRMSGEYELGPVLSSMGMSDAFTPARADFSGMDGGRNLYLSAVAHKAVLEVDEQGSEAAAATGAIMTLRAMPRTISFQANRPFWVAILHLPTRTVLFSGVVNDPGAE